MLEMALCLGPYTFTYCVSTACAGQNPVSLSVGMSSLGDIISTVVQHV